MINIKKEDQSTSFKRVQASQLNWDGWYLLQDGSLFNVKSVTQTKIKGVYYTNSKNAHPIHYCFDASEYLEVRQVEVTSLQVNITYIEI